MINKKNGFTLVELLIVMAILAIMGVILVGILNSIGITNKGRDAKRKKDLNRVKIAFEEYFNDKGYFPDGALVADLTKIDKSNCGSSTIFSPYLIPWPCDPKGGPYKIVVETNKFRIITDLENKKDKDIPEGWYLKDDAYRLFSWTINDVNYGVSSANILWYDGGDIDYSRCNIGSCLTGNVDTCGHVSTCTSNCFYQSSSGNDCTPGVCSVSCCGDGCNDP